MTDYFTLPQLEEEYTVGRFRVDEGTWLAEKRLEEAELPDEGVVAPGSIHHPSVGGPVPMWSERA